MIGPILHQELLLGSRRNRLHAFRWIYAGWLVLQVLFFCLEILGNPTRATSPRNHGGVPVSELAAIGGQFTETFVVQQLILLLLVTPAFVAGAITDEKRRGTLQ